MKLTACFVASFLPATIYAWGSLGHQLTGAVAQKLMAAKTAANLRQILPADFNGNVSRATTWADEVKRSAGYAGWSGPLHYVDSEDNPPAKCEFNMARDCPDGKCIIGAIANYTERLSCKHNKKEREEAAKFLSHFIGDLTQPLHTCARQRGGNEAKIATFDRKHTLNLHTVWDTTIVEKRVKNDFGNSRPKFIDYLLTQANTKYKSQQAKWTACLSGAGAARGGPSPASLCAQAWAGETNEVNCDTVWPAYDANPDQDFGAAYYEKAYPVVEQQIVKAGVRMARLFDLLAVSCNGDEGQA